MGLRLGLRLGLGSDLGSFSLYWGWAKLGIQVEFGFCFGVGGGIRARSGYFCIVFWLGMAGIKIKIWLGVGVRVGGWT